MLASKAGLWFLLISMVPHVGFEGWTVVLINFNGSPCWLRGLDFGYDLFQWFPMLASRAGLWF